MNEDSGIQKASSNVPHLKFTFGHSKVKVEVTAIANRIEESVKLAKRGLDEWLALYEGQNNVAQVAQLRPVMLTEESAVAEYRPADPGGVAGDGDRNSALDEIGGILQVVSTEDLLAVSRVIMQQLSRRSGSEYGDPTVAELLEIDAQVTRTPRPSGAPGVGDTVTNN